MRVILAGQKSFGLAVYEMLVEEGHYICDVWAPFGHSPRPDPLMAAVGDLWTSDHSPQRVARAEADLVVSAHSHDFVSRQVLRATKLGGIGYHPSLLPRHRGRDAVKWTIHMGDPITGGSVYWLTDNVDGGPIAAQEHVHIPPGWDASKLWREELFPLGITLLQQTLRDLDVGIINEWRQDEKCATWEPSWERPPLHRPDLVQIGAGIPGYEHRVTR